MRGGEDLWLVFFLFESFVKWDKEFDKFLKKAPQNPFLFTFLEFSQIWRFLTSKQQGNLSSLFPSFLSPLLPLHSQLQK